MSIIPLGLPQKMKMRKDHQQPPMKEDSEYLIL